MKRLFRSQTFWLTLATIACWTWIYFDPVKVVIH